MATAGLLVLLLLLVMSVLCERRVNLFISSLALPLQYDIEFFRSAIGIEVESKLGEGEEGGKKSGKVKPLIILSNYSVRLLSNENL
jgi:hypothetical protein